MIGTMLALALTAATQAKQDGLTPTDVLEFGQVTATGRFGMSFGSATLVDDLPASVDFDVDTEAYTFSLDLAVGLPAGFEVELHVPWQFTGSSEGDGSFGAADVETEQEVEGFGDLEFALNYRLVKEGAVLPHWAFGVIVVAPTGNDKEGQAQQEINGVQVQDDDEAGIGDGVWKYGFATGVSKKVSIAEVYGATSYVWGGERKRNGITEDEADVWTILAGVEWHVNDNARLDTRAFAQHIGKAESEDYDQVAGSFYKAGEEAYWAYGFQASLYVDLLPGVTVLLTGGAYLAQDHEANDVTEAEIEDLTAYFFQVGLHVFLGKSSK
jgi:hypothetical protein